MGLVRLLVGWHDFHSRVAAWQWHTRTPALQKQDVQIRASKCHIAFSNVVAEDVFLAQNIYVDCQEFTSAFRGHILLAPVHTRGQRSCLDLKLHEHYEYAPVS